MNKVELSNLILRIILNNKHKMNYTRVHTPLFDEDERVNILWLWCIENHHKFDPERSNLTGWVISMSFRVIDTYRKEQGTRRAAKTYQYPLTKNESGFIFPFEDVIPNPRTRHDTTERYGDHEYEIDQKDSIHAMWRAIDKTLSRLEDKVILQNYGRTINETVLSNALGIRKDTMQTRRNHCKRKIQRETAAIPT